jgi:hypothetical protein
MRFEKYRDAWDLMKPDKMRGPSVPYRLADESPEHRNFSPESLSTEFRGGATARMVMVVADPDAVFARAVKAGATVMSPGEDKESGWRVGRIADPSDITGKSASLWPAVDAVVAKPPRHHFGLWPVPEAGREWISGKRGSSRLLSGRRHSSARFCGRVRTR